MLERLASMLLEILDGTTLPEDIKDIEGVDIYTNFFPCKWHNEFAAGVPLNGLVTI